MGACCSKGEYTFESAVLDDWKESDIEYDGNFQDGDYGARVRLRGSSKLISMYSQQGRKGINQDAMTVWERFGGEKDMTFCGVFDGHGPSGHKVAQLVRDTLPSKLSTSYKQLHGNGSQGNEKHHKENKANGKGHEESHENAALLNSWKAHLVKSFKDVDEQLCADSSIDSYCSGTTSVALLKKGNHLVIANLGDSRAVLCTRDDKNQLASVQLTVDLKPNLPAEAERIKNCTGRVFALDEEPDVFRVWMPEEDCPGLAMARAFGDFCLKDFGLISVPEVTYRKLTDKDEFVVLATDGVWDVLTNNEVVKIVASARKRSTAARMLVDRAVRAWRCKYPRSKIDDCAVICLFLKERPLLTKSWSESSRNNGKYPDIGLPHYSTRSLRSEDGLTLINNGVSAPTSVINNGVSTANNWGGDDDDGNGVNRANSVVKVPRHSSNAPNARRANNFEHVQSQM